MHLTVLACSRERESAGRRMAMRTAMMPMTTSSSTRVNAGRRPLSVVRCPLFILNSGGAVNSAAGCEAAGGDECQDRRSAGLGDLRAGDEIKLNEGVQGSVVAAVDVVQVPGVLPVAEGPDDGRVVRHVLEMDVTQCARSGGEAVGLHEDDVLLGRGAGEGDLQQGVG